MVNPIELSRQKTCTACRVEKQVEDFHKNYYQYDGRVSECKECRSAFWRENPESLWSSNYRRRALRAGIQPKDFYVHKQELIERDGPGCAMCGDESVPLELDHIVGVAFGGSHSPWNTRLVCVPCHRSRRPEEAERRRYLRELEKKDGDE